MAIFLSSVSGPVISDVVPYFSPLLPHGGPQHLTLPIELPSRTCSLFEFPILKIGGGPYFPPKAQPVTLQPGGYTAKPVPYEGMDPA